MTEKERKIKELVVFAFKMINDYKQCDFLRRWVDFSGKDEYCRELTVKYLASEAAEFEEAGLIPKVPEEQDPILRVIRDLNEGGDE
jgi:hypothetical protein